MTYQEMLDFLTEVVEREFPKGVSQERGHALVLVAELMHTLSTRGVFLPEEGVAQR